MPRDVTLPNMGGHTISHRLTATLIEELRTGAFSEAERLPSEMELAERYKVSRSVIRDVMGNLEQEGFIARGRGVGTLIHRDIVKLDRRLDLKYEYNALIQKAGYQPRTDSVRVYTKPAEPDLADRLGLDVGEGLIVCEKRLLASGTPVIYSIDHLPQSLFAHTDYQKLDWATPVFALLEEHCGITVDTDIANISAVEGPADIRARLAPGPGEALLMIDEVGYYRLSRPILHTYGFYTNFFNFCILRKKF